MRHLSANHHHLSNNTNMECKRDMREPGYSMTCWAILRWSIKLKCVPLHYAHLPIFIDMNKFRATFPHTYINIVTLGKFSTRTTQVSKKNMGRCYTDRYVGCLTTCLNTNFFLSLSSTISTFISLGEFPSIWKHKMYTCSKLANRTLKCFP